MENDKESLAACKLSWKEVRCIFIRAGLQFRGSSLYLCRKQWFFMYSQYIIILIVASCFSAMGVGIYNLGKGDKSSEKKTTKKTQFAVLYSYLQDIFV